MEGYDYLLDKGVKLMREAQVVIEKYKDKYKEERIVYNTGLSFDILVMEYHRWVKDIQQFLELNFKDKVEASFFGEIDSVPTFDWLEENWYLDVDFIPLEFPQKIITETKKKLERIREIKRRDFKVKQAQQTKKGKYITELEFPKPIQWAKLELKIKEGLQDIDIFYNGKHIKTASYENLGFYSGEKEKKADRQWLFLTTLSVYSATDIKNATAQNMSSSLSKQTNKTINAAAIHQIKKNLVSALRDIFKTNDNPFTENKFFYEPKFKLLPAPSLRNEELWKQGGNLNENVSYDEIEE